MWFRTLKKETSYPILLVELHFLKAMKHLIEFALSAVTLRLVWTAQKASELIVLSGQLSF